MRELRYSSILAAVVAIIVVTTPAAARPYCPGMMGWGYGYGFGLLHMIIWLMILAAIVAGAVWLVRAGTPQFSARRSPGLQAPEERYARGEINRDEFLQTKQDISG